MKKPANSHLPDTLSKYVRTSEFKRKYGDWQTEGESDLLLDENSEPMVLWYGSPDNRITNGDNEEHNFNVLFADTDGCVTFSDNKDQAVNYAFAAFTNEIKKLCNATEELAEAFRFLQGRKGIRDVFKYVRNSLPQYAEQFSIVDIDAPRPISSLSEDERSSLIKLLKSVHEGFEQTRSQVCNTVVGNSIMERYFELKSRAVYLDYFKKNFGRLRRNDKSVLSWSKEGSESAIKDLPVQFYNASKKEQITVRFNESGKCVVDSPVTGTRPADSLDDAMAAEFLNELTAGLGAAIDSFNKDIDSFGFKNNTVLHPVFVKMEKPLSHDYDGSRLSGRYNPQPQYQTSFVISRQTTSARAKGCDGIICRNIADPFLGNTYGVFSRNNVIVIPRDLLPEEFLDVSIERPEPDTTPTEKISKSFKEAAAECIKNGSVNKVGEFHDGWSLVQRADGMYNYADRNGDFMTARWFNNATEFREGKAVVERENQKCEIDANGIITQVFGQGLSIV